jgi:hypothetical protein
LFVIVTRGKAISLSVVGIEVCFFVGRKAILRHLLGEASHMPQARLFSEEEWQKDFPNQQQIQRHWKKRTMSSNP